MLGDDDKKREDNMNGEEKNTNNEPEDNLSSDDVTSDSENTEYNPLEENENDYSEDYSGENGDESFDDSEDYSIGYDSETEQINELPDEYGGTDYSGADLGRLQAIADGEDLEDENSYADNLDDESDIEDSIYGPHENVADSDAEGKLVDSDGNVIYGSGADEANPIQHVAEEDVPDVIGENYSGGEYVDNMNDIVVPSDEDQQEKKKYTSAAFWGVAITLGALLLGAIGAGAYALNRANDAETRAQETITESAPTNIMTETEEVEGEGGENNGANSSAAEAKDRRIQELEGELSTAQNSARDAQQRNRGLSSQNESLKSNSPSNGTRTVTSTATSTARGNNNTVTDTETRTVTNTETPRPRTVTSTVTNRPTTTVTNTSTNTSTNVVSTRTVTATVTTNPN